MEIYLFFWHFTEHEKPFFPPMLHYSSVILFWNFGFLLKNPLTFSALCFIFQELLQDSAGVSFSVMFCGSNEA